MTSVRSLGRGLSALLGDIADDSTMLSSDSSAQKLNIEQIQPGIMQPRKFFDREKLEALASSIVQKGVLQPLLVRKVTNDLYEIVAGERRWRAAQMAGLTSLPVIIVDYNDQEALEIGLIENLQRDDLNPLEEAESLQKLIQEYDRTQEEVASAVGKSRSYVTNTLRLLQLPESVQQFVREGKLSAGHARALINHKNAEQLAQQIVEEGLNVRAVETITKNKKAQTISPKYTLNVVDSDVILLSEQFTQAFALPCMLKVKGSKAELRISFNNLEDIDALLSKLRD